MLKHIWDKIADAIIAKAKRQPWLHIRVGEYTTTDPNDANYMERYWFWNPYETVTDINPDNPRDFCTQWHERKLPSIRVHHIKMSDSGKECHDHPWWFLTIILKGSYIETRPIFEKVWFGDSTVETGKVIGFESTRHGPGSILFRSAYDFHRIDLDPSSPDGAWTLFTTGKKIHTWGFLMESAQGWYKLPYKLYHALGKRKQG